MTNIAELLKDAPKDLKLYSPICGHCKLSCILYDDGIRVIAHDVPFRFDKYGRFCSADDAECLLFPGEDCRTWENFKLTKFKFKVGDWIVRNDGSNYLPIQVYAIKNDRYLVTNMLGSKGEGMVTCQDECRLWTIQDAKDGDILVTTKVRSCPFIYRKTSYNNNLAYYYAGIDGNGDFCEGCLKRTLCHFGSVENVVPATNEQRDLLFAKMKDAGYEWDAGKKELRKIKPHYDIDNFKPKQWVLVRDDDEWEWALTRFSYLSYGSASLFVCINGASFQQCIPFEDNEKLLGTTDMCDEQYINW